MNANTKDIKDKLLAALEEAIAEWPLPNHPFLQRFAEGGFDQDAIRWWAIKMLPGSNRFNQAFLKVTARVDDYRARILLLNNVYSEHGELDPDGAHVALFMRFMRGIGCPRVDVHEDDGAFRIPELRFKRFEIQDNEPIIWSLGRFAAIECVLPNVFTKYIAGLRKIFPGIDDHTIEYFPIHCILDPEHTDQLLEVASLYVNSDIDVMTFQDGVRDMLLSMSDMFTWMGRNMAVEAGTDALLRSTLSSPTASSNGSGDSKNDVHLTDADIYDGIYERDEAAVQEAEFVLARLAGVSSPSVLDLCAGTGSLARQLAAHNVRVAGIDTSGALLEVARRKVPDGRFLQADIRSLQLGEQFDAVVCMNGALHHIREPQDIVRVLRVAKDHLRPGGALIVELHDHMRLPDSLAGNGNSNAWSSWLPHRGQEDSDLYALSGIDTSSGRHVLSIQNFFHTDPFRIANWARLAGYADVRLHTDYLHDDNYERTAGDGKVVLVARKAESAQGLRADPPSMSTTTSG